MKRIKKFFVIVVSVTLTVLGLLYIPQLITKISSKLYKASLKKEQIDYDSYGPEIVKNDNGKEG